MAEEAAVPVSAVVAVVAVVEAVEAVAGESAAAAEALTDAGETTSFAPRRRPLHPPSRSRRCRRRRRRRAPPRSSDRLSCAFSLSQMSTSSSCSS